MAVKRLLIFAVLITCTVRAADAPFGDIPASLSLSTSQSVRRNAANNGFEAYTPSAGGGGVWGSITGTLSNQTDLQTALDAKTNISIVPNTAPSAGQILVGNAGGTAYAPKTLSGSGATATLSSAGVLTLSGIANASLTNSAITIAGTSTSLGGSITLDTITGLSSGGIVKRTGANTLDIAVAGTDYLQNNQLITLSGEVSGSGATSITTTQTHFVTFDVEGVGIVLSTGTKNPFKTKYGGTLVGWTMMCKPSGSVTVDVFRAASGAGLPVTSIVGGATKPAIASDVEASGTSFSGWTSTTINANDNLAISLSGITTVQYVEFTLWFK